VTARGKTEAIALCKQAADGRVDELTRAGLLSWSTVGKKVRRSGLLTRVPPVAFVTISDFSTVVTMGDREARARMFGALRVIYDGRLYRSIGGQPAGDGEELEWEGRLTLLAAATPAVDTHFSFEAALGERWLLFRLDEGEDDRVRKRARYAVDREDVTPLREQAQQLAAALVHHARQRVPRRLTNKSVDIIVDAAFLVAHARTGVQFEGTGRYRCVMGYPFPEEPARLAGQMSTGGGSTRHRGRGGGVIAATTDARPRRCRLRPWFCIFRAGDVNKARYRGRTGRTEPLKERRPTGRR
jgi:hypothetical protein